MTDYDAVVIGAGFSGIRTLWELQQLGLSMKCFDAALDIGGTWYWNRYPGARTDVDSWTYLMNFAPELLDEWKLSQRCASRDEVQQYLGRIADRYDLRKYITFGVRVLSAIYSQEKSIWTITTDDNRSATCRYFIPATGVLSVPKKPSFAGLESFQGETYLAAKWPEHQVSFFGKRVATGVQFVPEVASAARHLAVFQRTPNYHGTTPSAMKKQRESGETTKRHEALQRQAPVSGQPLSPPGRSIKGTDREEVQRILDHGCELGFLNFWGASLDDIMRDPDSNECVSKYVRQRIRSTVQDPETAELLSPKYGFGAKRPVSGHGYYEAFNRSNVSLVDASRGDVELYEKGVRMSDGTEFEFDMVIFALGFDVGCGALNQIDIRGLNGKTLRDKWEDKLQTFAGLLVPGFPNMFTIGGPHGPLGNQPLFNETSVNWLGKIIKHMEDNGLDAIDVQEEAAEKWTSRCNELWSSFMLARPAEERRNHLLSYKPEKPAAIMFFLGGQVVWRERLDREIGSWESMHFTRLE